MQRSVIKVKRILFSKAEKKNLDYAALHQGYTLNKMKSQLHKHQRIVIPLTYGASFPFFQQA